MAVSDFVWYTAIAASCQEACSALLDSREKLGRLSFDYSRLRQFLCSWEKSSFVELFLKKNNSINEKSETKDKAAHKLAGDAVEIRLEHVALPIRAAQNLP